jgi:hypothetical protein
MSKMGIVIGAAILLAFEGCGLFLVRAGISVGGLSGAFAATVGGLVALFFSWIIYLVASKAIRTLLRRFFARYDMQERGNGDSC